MFMFLFDKLRRINSEANEKKRTEEEKKRKWRDKWNEFYYIGDMVAKSLGLGAEAIGTDALGVTVKRDGHDVLSKLFNEEFTMNVDERLSIKLVKEWDSEMAKRLKRTDNVFTEFETVPEILNSVSFYIDGLEIDYNYKKYSQLAKVVCDFIEKRVKEVSAKKKNLVEDYLKQKDVSC